MGFHLEAQPAIGITPNNMFSLSCCLLSLDAILARSICSFISLLCSEARLLKISFSTSLFACCCCCLILMSLTFSKCILALQSPTPNCPFSLLPQLQTLPSQSTACKCRDVQPGEREDILGTLLTFSGIFLFVLSPNPSCPNWFDPQVKIFPSLSRNMEQYSPPEAATTFTSLSFLTALLLLVVCPSPSSPLALDPQTHTLPPSSIK